MDIFKQIKKYEKCSYHTPKDIDAFLEEIGDDFKLLKTNKKIEYFNIPCAFDIETTSFILPNQLGNKSVGKCSLMYEWTLGINFVIMVGRTWEEFLTVLEKIEEHFQTYESRRLIIYAHNLSFEFQAFRKLLDWKRVFALEKRKPVQAVTKSGIEFRCSYLLSGKSLDNVGKDLSKYKVSKLVGSLDYELLRHPKTPLSKKELQYCINDCLVVMAYIQELIERDGDIRKIPLTKTGYVRNLCRNSCFYADKSHKKNVRKYSEYRDLMSRLRLGVEEYKLLKEAFMGGFTHSNPYNSRGIMHEVCSVDYCSSYPAVMLSEKFPMSTGEYVDITSKEQFNELLETHCCLFEIAFENIRPKVWFENYIPYSKTRHCTNYVENNGRIVKADYLEITITEQDFYIINNMYEWDNVTIGRFIKYKRGYLPTDFVKAIWKFYVDKTRLKGVDSEIVNYNLAKENVNSCYGMIVTDICRDEIEYNGDWDKEEPDLEKMIDKYNNNKRRFLFYPWGIWVTAYARYNLFMGIFEFGEDYIYSDTDSIKGHNLPNHLGFINQYNELIQYKLEKAFEYHKIDKKELLVKNNKGEVKLLGAWEIEKSYDRFKTLGAKRYMYEIDGVINITVSGLRKQKTVPYLLNIYGDKVFENFDEGLYVPPEYTGKMTHTYIDEECSGEITDYLGVKYGFTEKTGTHLEKADYSLSLSKKYVDYLLGIKENIYG